jgi:hypothetical protein
MFEDAWNNAQAGNTPTLQHDSSSPELNHCDKTSVGGSVQSTANAMPVRSDLEPALSYLIARKVANNDYGRVRSLSSATYVGSNQCPSAQSNVASKPIDAYALAGPLFISVVLTGAGLIARVFQKPGELRAKAATLARQISQDREVAVSQGREKAGGA